MLGGKDLMEKFSFKRLAPDVFQFNKKTDTFFQVVTNSLTLATEVMVKKSVTDVSKMRELYTTFAKKEAYSSSTSFTNMQCALITSMSFSI
jgi:hypothetical protein